MQPSLQILDAKFDIVTGGPFDYGEGGPEEGMPRTEVLGYLWKHVEIIDQYLQEEGSSLTQEDQATIAGWKRVVSGMFYMERVLKSGAVLIGGESSGCYLVQPFMSEWEDMYESLGLRLPVVIEANLLPFDGVIVTDGHTKYLPVMIGSGLKNTLKNEYRRFRTEKKVQKTLCGPDVHTDSCDTGGPAYAHVRRRHRCMTAAGFPAAG